MLVETNPAGKVYLVFLHGGQNQTSARRPKRV